MMEDKWVQHFLRVAKEVASMSKDPSSQVGAVIVGKDKRLVSTGFNGFAKGVEDRPEYLNNRDRKYLRVIHAEQNSILFANTSVEGCTMIVTHPCCARCAAVAIQAGITTVMWPKPSEAMAMRWAEDFEAAADMFQDAGVQIHVIE